MTRFNPTGEDPLVPKDLGPEGQAAWDEMSRGATMRADEKLLLAEACRLIDDLAKMRREGTASTQQVRLAQEQLRKLLTSVRWEGAADGGQMSQWGRELANRRHHGRG